MDGHLERSASAMQIKGCPSPKRGNRNLWCPNYAACLDYAVSHDWRAWNCFRCPYKFLEEAPDLRDFPGYGSTFFYEMATWPKKEFDTDF